LRPIHFPAVNEVLKTAAEDVGELPVFHNPGQCLFLSRWKATWRERLSVLFYGTIWVAAITEEHPPIAISGIQYVGFITPTLETVE